jgi:endonuclease YncB( thermonuclease family)
MAWRYERVTVLSVHDGDTCDVEIDRGFREKVAMEIRCYGYNAIELSDPGGVEARAHFIELLEKAKRPDGFITMESYKNDRHDKYGGRWLGVFLFPDGTSVNEKMVADGFGKPYFGRGVKPT